MKKGLEEILDACLDRIRVNGDTVEQCLGSYPEHEAELEPLLRAALSVTETLSTIKPGPEFERVAKYRLLSALEAKEAKRTEHRMPLWGWQRRWAVVFAVIVVLLLVGSGAITASASSLPGDTLYPVKTATEKVQEFFTRGNEAKASFNIKLAQRRINELESLSDGNRSIPQSLLNTMHAETDRAIETLGQQKPVKGELVTRLLDITSKQSTSLAKVIEKAPSEAKSKLQEALKRSESAHGRALSLREKMQEMEKPNTQLAIPWPGDGGLLYSGGNETGVYDSAAGGNGSPAYQQHILPGEQWYGSH
jgi:hypothetical protein